MHVPPDQLLEFVDAGHPDRPSVDTVINPELAQQFLDRVHPDQTRPISDQKISRYVYALQNPGAEAGVLGYVSFAPDGSLLGGRHILHAIIQTGVPAPVWVNVNVTPPTPRR